MELESLEFLSNFNYFSSESSRGNSSSYQSSDQDCIQQGNFFYGKSMEELLQMDICEIPFEFDPISPHNFNMNLNFAETDSWIEPNDDDLLREEENSYFKGIQEELMDENSLTDLLLAAAEAVESQNHSLASDLIQKLKNILLSNSSIEETGSSFNRLSWFFTQGLYYKSVNIAAGHETKAHENDTMSAFQMLQELSPYIKFAHFTANQAILEAAKGEKALHIIDFDIMEGFQWPPLMTDLEARKDSCLLRITAVVHDRENERKIQQTGRRLCEFAESINFPFVFDHIMIEKEDDFGKIQVIDTVIANFSGILQHDISRNGNLSKKSKSFLCGITTKLSPKCIVLVEEQLFKVSKTQPIMSFVEFFFEAFHHFSALSESLTKCFSGSYENGFRQIEEFLGTRILDSLAQFPCEKRHFDAFDHLKEYKKMPFSSFNYSQAKYLISLFRGDFWVQHENCKLSLCWKSRPLCTATIWVPIRDT